MTFINAGRRTAARPPRRWARAGPGDSVLLPATVCKLLFLAFISFYLLAKIDFGGLARMRGFAHGAHGLTGPGRPALGGTATPCKACT